VHLVLTVIHYALHLDSELPQLIVRYGELVYVILFAIIFAETGFVVTPFLPGDSLIFVAGAMAATAGGLNAFLLVVVLTLAAVLGNTANYWAGRFFGPRVFHWEHSRWFNRHALDETHAFYLRHGAMAVSAARFIPIVRTFAPFVAGVGDMPHARFQLVNVLSALVWVAGFIVLGYFFGNLEVVRHNLMFIMVAVVVISVLPAIMGGWRARSRLRARRDSGGR